MNCPDVQTSPATATADDVLGRELVGDDPAVSSEERSSRRIWVRSCQPPDAALGARESIDRIGGNQGNLLYQFATFRTLSTHTTRLTTLPNGRFDTGDVATKAEEINSEADHLVLPLSSSFRLQMLDVLDHWADLIERLTIPVTVVGIGTQLRLVDAASRNFLPSRVTGVTASSAQVSAHEAAARRFIAAVLDRSNSIGVRGDVTRDYLVHLGFPAERIEVIGCPSLFMWGPDFRMPESAKRLTARSKLSLSFDHRIPSTAEILEQAVRAHPRSTVYAQEKLTAKMIIDRVETRPNWQGDPRFPVHLGHELYRSRRMVYQPTAWSWLRHLERQDFAFGPRLHGTIAAILAGTPAHLLVHDSRTLELAEYHGLPHTRTEDLESVRTARDLHARTDFRRFNGLYPQRFEAYLAFLKRNGLPNAYAESSGRALADFDSSVRSAAAVKAVISGARIEHRTLAPRVRELTRAAVRSVHAARKR